MAELAIVRGGEMVGAMVGAIHLAFHDDWRASVAYWLAPDVRGRGVATRAVTVLLRWAFEEFTDLVRVELWSIFGNVASDGVVPPSGLRRGGHPPVASPNRGSYRDVRCFSLLRDDRTPDAG